MHLYCQLLIGRTFGCLLVGYRSNVQLSLYLVYSSGFDTFKPRAPRAMPLSCAERQAEFMAMYSMKVSHIFPAQS